MITTSEQMVPTRVGRLKVTVAAESTELPTAVLWHSLFVDERSWQRVIPDLAQDRQLILVTGPGHGRSGDSGDRYSMEECAEAAIEVIDAAQTEGPVDWVGNAWGGHVGIVLAATTPHRVRTLVAAGTPVHPYPRASRMNTRFLVLLYKILGPTTFLTDAVVSALISGRTRSDDPEAAGLVRDCFVSADRAGLVNAIVSISLNRRDLRPLLPSVQAPTLFMTGSEHPDWTPEQMRAAAALLPNGSTQVLEGAAYLVPLEVPADFSRLTREFWAAHPATDGAPR